jgi:hypothetical protein
MTDTQEARLGMFEVVIAYLILEANIAIWTGNARVTAAKTWLENAITRIRLHSMIQKADHKGLTSAKKQHSGELISAMLKVIDGLVPYATDTNNADLLSVVRIPKSVLNKAKDNDLVDYANLIYQKAEPLAHELEGFNVTEADIQNVKTKKDIYTIAIPAKRVSDVDKALATDNLKLEFSNTGKYLRETFDNLMLQYRTSHPDFYSGYKKAREIIDVGTSKKTSTQKPGVTSITLQALHFETLAPLIGVKFICAELDAEHREMITDENGNAAYILEFPGAYNFTAEKDGFNSQAIDTINISKGQQLSFAVELEPIQVPA